jgi:hypothetical protein
MILQTLTAEEKRARKHRTPVQLGVTPELYDRFRRKAASEGLNLAAWLRHLALRELRRRKPR